MKLASKKSRVTIYLTPTQHAELRALTERTGVPQSRLVREGIDLVLASVGGEAGEERA